MMTDPTQLFNGMKVISNPLCTTEEPVRVHIMKGTQRQTYHDRIQKKWNKRFGMKRVPGMYIMNQSYFTDGNMGYGGGSEKVIIAHPVIIEKMKNMPPAKVDPEKIRNAFDNMSISAHYASDNMKRFGEALNKMRNPHGIINMDVGA